MSTRSAHEAAVKAAGLDPAHVFIDVWVDAEGEHLLVEEVTDAWDVAPDGSLVTREHVIPIDEGHPWWHDTTSVLPRFDGAETR